MYLRCMPLLFLALEAVAIPLRDFYPFGIGTSDVSLSRNDDGNSGRITLSFSFPYFGTDNGMVYVNNNGVVSFNAPVSQFTSASFPLGDMRMLIAPYWADVDTRGTGTVWYRETTNQTLLLRARREIRAAFVSQMSFQPTMLFIATWDHVGYFSRSTDLTNTFQCVLITDGRRSFVIFNYADGEIQWTTGDASGGRNGFGGTEAQVGFNAGDGLRFASVPGSQTPNIVNIDTTSNVAVPGVWVFRVDAEEITVAPDCTPGPGVPLNVGPRVGSQFGGTAVYITGPCFNEDSAISCFFSDIGGATGYRVSDLVAVCVSPSFGTPGWKSLRVGVRNGESDDTELELSAAGRFYAIPPEDTANVRLDQNTVLLSQESSEHLTVRWDPQSILPTIEPSSYTVDIDLFRFQSEADSNSSSEFRPFISIMRDQSNTGVAEFNVPEVDEISPDVYPVAVRISVGRLSQLGSETLTLIDRLGRGVVAQWTSTLYYAVSMRLEALCLRWCASQPSGIGETIRDRLPPCPRRADQARTPNSGFVEDSGYWTRQANRFFHPEAETCFRQSSFNRSHMGSGQQCCYRRNGNLLVGPGSGGSVDLVAPNGVVNTFQHFVEDVIPAIYCCKGGRSNSTCRLYYEKRPSDDGSRYNPPAPACVYGDPHIVTLDGFKYTFNGAGEYVLIETSDNSFSLQGRMVPVLNLGEVPVAATVFSAIVGRELYSDTVQFQLAENNDVDVLMNGELLDFEDLPEQQFNNVTVRKGERSASAVFASGVYVEVRAANGILSTLLVSLAEGYRSQTTGLMGNYNGDRSDDLLPRGSSTPIPLSSSLQDIHNIFGVTWIVDRASDSLFTYAEEESWSTFYRPSFMPIFEPQFSGDDIADIAQSICGTDPFCLFDIAATGRTDIGLTTLQGNIEFEEISNISQPVVCNPPCEFGVCVRTDSCSCADGYTGDTCAEGTVGECEENPCENGGSCTFIATSYVCSCPDGYSGVFCEERDFPPFPGSGDPPVCTCSRDIECSLIGRLQDSQLTPQTEELKCTIIAGPEASNRESIVVDSTFSSEFLSPGSLSFLSSIGILSRDVGFSPCAIDGNPNQPFIELLGIEALNVIYTRPDGSFGSVDLGTDSLEGTDGGEEEFTDRPLFEVNLDDTNQCSLQNLLQWITAPQPPQVLTCRDPTDSDGGTTVAYFPIACTSVAA